MFTKRLLQKAIHHHPQKDTQHGKLKPVDFDPSLHIHFGIPNTASILAVDPIQQLLAIGTLDGRIKVIGGYNIEALLTSPKQKPYKNLEFMQNKGYLVGVLNDNDIQVWSLERRCVTCCLQWESNITTFSVLSGSPFMFVGDEYGMVSVLKYGAKDNDLVVMPYHMSPDFIHEKTGISLPNDQSVVGVLPQPSSFGNRLLIAYQYGLFILWDVLESKVIVIKGEKDLLIKDHISDLPSELATDPLEDAHEHMDEKEISALCWASSVGSMLAVGYIDGDILLWNIPRGAFVKRKNAGVSRDDVVKLQLSSAEKRLPVIYLCWGENNISQSSCGGQLFVYGGCEIGSEEVITVVSLQWSPGMEVLKGVRRVDLSLMGAFADMVSLSSLETAGKSLFDGLFILTRPGKLQFYTSDSLSALVSQSERNSFVSGIESPVVIPTSHPQMTAAMLSLQPSDENLSVWLSEMASVSSTLNPAEGKKWPLTGGVPREIASAKERTQKIIYIAGYQDGSVRIWDATDPIISLVSNIEGQVHGIADVGSNVSVTKLDFCASTMSLAVGTHSGEVRVYCLNNDAGGTKLYWIKHSERIVYDVQLPKGPQCRAVFTLVNSPVQSLRFSASGAKLAVGFESSHVAVLDMISLSILFTTDPVANSNSQVISVNLKTFSDAQSFTKGPKHSESENIEQPGEELLFTLTQDAKVNVADSKTGSPINSRPLQLKEHTAISMYVLEGSHFMSASSAEHCEQSNKETKIPDEPKQDVSQKKDELKDTKHLSMDGDRLQDSVLLLCCENTVRLYNTKSVIQGEDKPICKVKLAKPCSWTSIFTKDDKIVGLILVYQSGVFEVRSVTDLELLAESSLLSILRWNTRLNMKLASSTDHGQICLANGSELAFISLSTCEIESRFLGSLPSLHDEVVAAATDAAMSFSVKQKKQIPHIGIIGDIVKGLKKDKSKNSNDNILTGNLTQLGETFSRPVVPDSSMTTGEDIEEEKELDIDDIEIDEPVMVASTSSHQSNLDESAKGKTTKAERDKLFDGAPIDLKPRTRTPEEIMAKYKGAEYAAAAAERAKNKLVERQEKLENINQRTEDLRYEAENFASMANELVKTMEGKKKWWKI
ncbi:Syntaxin-binding protein 5-like [Bienertia sinuspersici]